MSLLAAVLCVPAFALTESEVEAQVTASGKESVTGNVLIWFLCAVAFLKVSQKIDSFMATLGVNVGRTGGSMLAEAMIAMRAVTMVISGGRSGGRAGAASNGAAGRPESSGMAGFFKGGLVGMAGRHITSSAVKTATTQTSAVHTAQSQERHTAAVSDPVQSGSTVSVHSEAHTGGTSVHTENSIPTGMPPQEGMIVTSGGTSAVPIEHTPPDSPAPDGVLSQEGVILTGNETPPAVPHAEPPVPEGPPADAPPSQDGIIMAGGETMIHMSQADAAGTASGQHTQTHSERISHTTASSEKTSRFPMSGAACPTLGGTIFSKSLAAGGSFANDVIGTVARGEVAGSITGDMAAQSLASYMGYASPGIESREAPAYSDVEIGRGRITGVETAAGSSEGMPFAMYHVGQYAAPQGEFQKVFTADGTQWYKQYAQDAVERKPYMAPDDTVAYHEKIVKKLPDPPKRKDRI